MHETAPPGRRLYSPTQHVDSARSPGNTIRSCADHHRPSDYDHSRSADPSGPPPNAVQGSDSLTCRSGFRQTPQSSTSFTSLSSSSPLPSQSPSSHHFTPITISTSFNHHSRHGDTRLSWPVFLFLVFLCCQCTVNQHVFAWQTLAPDSNSLEPHLDSAILLPPPPPSSSLSSSSSIIHNDQPEPIICGNIDIRNDVKNFRKLENCTVIEGHLQIVLIDRGEYQECTNISVSIAVH
jgi:hypothetical protein